MSSEPDSRTEQIDPFVGGATADRGPQAPEANDATGAWQAEPGAPAGDATGTWPGPPSAQDPDATLAQPGPGVISGDTLGASPPG